MCYTIRIIKKERNVMKKLIDKFAEVEQGKSLLKNSIIGTISKQTIPKENPLPDAGIGFNIGLVKEEKNNLNVDGLFTDITNAIGGTITEQLLDKYLEASIIGNGGVTLTVTPNSNTLSDLFDEMALLMDGDGIKKEGKFVILPYLLKKVLSIPDEHIQPNGYVGNINNFNVYLTPYLTVGKKDYVNPIFGIENSTVTLERSPVKLNLQDKSLEGEVSYTLKVDPTTLGTVYLDIGQVV